MAGEFSVAYFRIVSMSFAPTFTTLNSSPGLIAHAQLSRTLGVTLTDFR